jgi:hypothetical protein
LAYPQVVGPFGWVSSGAVAQKASHLDTFRIGVQLVPHRSANELVSFHDAVRPKLLHKAGRASIPALADNGANVIDVAGASVRARLSADYYEVN